MKEAFFITSNYALFLILTGVLITFQSCFWFEIFGFFPSPYTWVPILTYWTLYKQPKETLIMIYCVTFLISASTTMPLSLLLIAHLLLYGLGYFLKLHIYWSSTYYFLLFAISGTFLLPPFYFVLSILLGLNERKIYYFHSADWIIASLLTAFLALPLYKIFRFFDQVTQRPLRKEAGEINLGEMKEKA